MLHVESDHIPPGSRSDLVDAVLDLPEVQDKDRLTATVPLETPNRCCGCSTDART